MDDKQGGGLTADERQAIERAIEMLDWHRAPEKFLDRLRAILARVAPKGAGIGAHALAAEISAAVAEDEAGEGCDISAGMFGPKFSALIRKIASEYLAGQQAEQKREGTEMSQHTKCKTCGAWISKYDDEHRCPAPPKDCQHGYADLCAAGARDGVVCPDDSCDIDDGIRKAEQPAEEAREITARHRASVLERIAEGSGGRITDQERGWLMDIAAALRAEAARAEQPDAVLGPDEDGLPIARYSHRSFGMAPHLNGTWVRYAEVQDRLRRERAPAKLNGD